MGPLECITKIDAVQQKVWHGLRMSKAMSSNINLQISILLRKVPSEKLHWKTIYIYTHWASRVLVFQFSANVFPVLGCLSSLSHPPWWTDHSITLHPTFLNYCIAALETKFQVAMCSVEPTLAGELVIVDGGCMCTRTGPHWWAPRSDPHRWGPSVEYNGRTTHLVGPTASVYLHVDGEIQMKQC